MRYRGRKARVARWDPVRVAIDATACPRPRAECSPGREHVHNGACHCQGSSKTSPGWEYQLAAVAGQLRTAWAAIIDVRRTTRPPARPGRSPRPGPWRAGCAPPGRRPAGPAALLLVFDAGYSAAALTDGLAGYPARILVRLPAGSTSTALRPGTSARVLKMDDGTPLSGRALAGSGPEGSGN